MNWITFIWSANAGICLTLAAIYLMVWCRSRNNWSYLLFSVAATGAAGCAVVELVMMHSQTTVQYGQALRWWQLPAQIMIVSLVWFVRRYLQAGRFWLAWLVSGLRGVWLVLSFWSDPNLNFRIITGLKQLSVLGDTIVLSAIGEKHPWTNINNVGTLLFLFFVLDACYTAWRQGERRRVVGVGGPIALAIALGIVQSILLVRGMLPMPASLSFLFLIIIIGISYQLSDDLLRANEISRKLQETKERMQLAADAADLGMWEWDVVRDEIWTNEVGRARAGIGISERINFDRFLQSVHPGDREATRQDIQRTLDHGTQLMSEYRIVTPEGEDRWVSTIGLVEHGLNHKPLSMRGVSMDITERKDAQDALQRSEQLARILLNAHSAMTHLIDIDGTIIDLNEPIAKALGGTREELIGTNVFDGFPQELVVRRKEMLRRVANEQKQMRFEDGNADGSMMFDTFIYPVETPPGEKQRFVVFAHDITERKRIEQQLLDYQQHLKALTSQLTLAEEKTRQKIAADLHDHIGHSLTLARIQLNGILESGSWLEAGILVKDISALLLKALQDTRQLIFDLGSTSLEDFGLGPAISEWLEERIGKPHRMKTEFVNNLPDNYEEKINEDIKVLLFRNIRELLTNVVKHARAHLISVFLSCDGNNLSISIEDDGIGFNPDESDKVVISKKGFGLLSVRTRMINMGGAFNIYSEPGKGCRMVLTVPMNPVK